MSDGQTIVCRDGRQPAVIAWCFCGSFCTLDRAIRSAEDIEKKNGRLLCVVSESVQETDTRFGRWKDIYGRIFAISRDAPILTVKDAEPIGPKLRPDVMIIAPCTGNTLAKLANGITDSAVTMAAKAHLRNNRPLVIALATNDALSANLKNIGVMLERKNVYFVPLGQDDPKGKPSSLVCDYSKLEATLECALRGEQIEPLICSH